MAKQKRTAKKNPKGLPVWAVVLLVLLIPTTIGGVGFGAWKILERRPAQASGNPPSAHAPTGVVLNQGGGGGAGGAVQAVRQAVVRTVNQNEMHNLHIFIDTASGASGQMPTVEEITRALEREAPKTHKLVQNGAIVLTGTNSREGIWAYTADPQTTGGEHLVVTASGVDRMTMQAIRQRTGM
jgi:hypothetical protein